MKKQNVIKRICIIFMLSIITISNVGPLLAIASNWEDTPYSAYSGDGSDSATDIRGKTDTSQVYAYNKNTNDRTHRINIAGTHQISGHGSPFSYNDCTYGAYYFDVKPGMRRYMSSLVYERGYRNAFLVFAEANHKLGWLYGEWSPDSIGTYK